MEIFGLLIGVPLGVLASLVAWWYTEHFVVPKIEFSSDICKSFYMDSKQHNYRFKFKNVGKRDIIDVEVFAEHRVRGLNPAYPKQTDNARLSVGGSRMPVLRAGYSKMLSIKPQNTIAFKRKVYGSEINDKYENGTLTLDDIMTLGNESTIEFFVFGYDRSSGTRKLFESDPCRAINIKEGKWREMEVVSEGEHTIAES